MPTLPTCLSFLSPDKAMDVARDLCAFRSDLYAPGLILYEMFTGRRFFWQCSSPLALVFLLVLLRSLLRVPWLAVALWCMVVASPLRGEELVVE